MTRATTGPAAISSPRQREAHVMLGHGGGGQLTDELLGGLVLPRLGNAVLDDLLDAAVIDHGRGERLALTIDSYVVQPLTFPGGDIGRLAVCGTVNDLAVCGAIPSGIALSLILAEGLEKSVLEAVLDSVRRASQEAGVRVVTGDTKVVGRGHADGMYITTAGVGRVPKERRLHPSAVRGGDVILLSGAIAEHGLAVMLAREMPDVPTKLRSDVNPLNHLIERLLRAVPDVAFLRDPTRGGLAGLAADLATRTGLHVVLEEASIPLHPEAAELAEVFGLDPLEVANEGKVVAVVRPGDADAALAALRDDPLGREAAVIGRVAQDGEPGGLCELHTLIGGRRIVQKPYGEQLPRIC